MLLNLIPPFLYATQFLPGRPTHYWPLPIYVYNRLVPTQDHPTTWASPISVPSYQYPLLPDSDSDTYSRPPPSPQIPDSRHSALATAKISSNIALRCFQSAVFRQHISRSLPPTLYTAPYHKPCRLVSMPPTLPLSFVSRIWKL